ncbi:MAG: rod shape-determining protein MreC [Candidatus Omnitrophica bacterium]|nr:rod shape-determining protein MreC [Candidatus Omnitrophota bacterium]MBL7210195.1 rod shape-determining protein MreC [Candidatus Omnitrophota bacterium]
MFNLKKKPLIFCLFVSLCFILLFSLSPALRTPLINTLKYPLSLFSVIGREAHGLIFYHRNFTQNRRFRNEIDLLKQRLNDSEEVALENERLKKLFSIKQRSSFKVILARVIAGSADSWSSSIIIDKGSSSGIKRGMAVITYLGLAGRVVETTGSASKIMLISDPDLSISGIVQRSRQEGIVSGTLGANLIMRYLPEDSDIRIGDTVVTSGLSKACPKGLLIGSVIEIGREYSGLSRYAIIKPAVNLSSIEEVLVVIL